MKARTSNSFDILDFRGIVGIAIVIVIVMILFIFFVIFVFTFVGIRWIVLNTCFRCKLYIPCRGYYDLDTIHKLNWLRKHYRWRHIVEQDLQLAEHPNRYLEEGHARIRGVFIRFTRKKHAIHFKLACHNNMEESSINC